MAHRIGTSCVSELAIPAPLVKPDGTPHWDLLRVNTYTPDQDNWQTALEPLVCQHLHPWSSLMATRIGTSCMSELSIPAPLAPLVKPDGTPHWDLLHVRASNTHINGLA